METLPDNVRPLDYSSPLREQRRSPAVVWLIAVLSLFAAVITGDSVLDEFRHRERTQGYIQYAVSQDGRRQNDPTYVPPPFTGRKFVYQTPFELKAFYACLLFGATGGLAIRSALRRQRPPGDAG
jgi:hypothetical protein